MYFMGQLARLPMTARQKFEEAAYFYNQMLALRTDFRRFPFYLSAFLSALRSVTFYLQKQYSGDDPFREWYGIKQQEMEADPVLKMLNKKRVGVVHRQPVDLYYDLGFKWREEHDEYIETTQFEVSITMGADGLIKMRMKPNAEAEEEDVTAWIKWVFKPDDEADVMESCDAGLQKIDAILKELELLRVEAGLPADEEIEELLAEVEEA
ncbi:MAG TPA: hypothetical protein VHX14_02910 [Thermoanaerobaculia bacterium]|nr:hypothetical protein [Thermoanaerobaculia bacterium]